MLNFESRVKCIDLTIIFANMIIHNNISPLPFYADISEQHHRRPYTYGQVCPVICEKGDILPFQFIIDTEAAPTFGADFNYDFDKEDYVRGDTVDITAAAAVNLSSSASTSILPSLTSSGRLSAHLIEGSSSLVIVRYLGGSGVVLPEGHYYLKLELEGGHAMYSDVFAVCADTSNYLKLEYRSSHNLVMAGGYIDFADNFTFKCFIDAELGKPEYSFEEEATSRMGYTFIETQVSKKIYKFTFPGTEEMCDALRLVRLCDQKRITNRHKAYMPITFNMSANWEDQGDIAAIDCEFEVDNIIQNIGNLK